jgi:hypothetical protein
MIRFDGQNLFDSGPSRLEIGGVGLRHASQPAIEGAGVRLASQGTRGRSIIQRGTLRADTPETLTMLRQAIEAKVDGQSYTLLDAHGRSWTNVVMLQFEPSPVERLGPRWKLDYRIEYLQLTA